MGPVPGPNYSIKGKLNRTDLIPLISGVRPMISVSRLLAAATIAVSHFAISLALGPTQAFYCIALGDCVEDSRRPWPKLGALDWPISALPTDASHWFLGSSFPVYSIANDAVVALIAWVLLCLVARFRRSS